MKVHNGESPQAVIFSSPPLTIAHLMGLIKKYFSSTLIFEVRDLWPLSLIELGNYRHDNPFIQWLKKLEKRAYKLSDHIVGVIPGLNAYVKNQSALSGLEADVTHIPQSYFETDLPETRELPVCYDIGYAGSLNKANDVETLLEALSVLARKGHHPKVLIIGTGEKEHIIKNMVKDLVNVEFIDNWLSRGEVLSKLAQCRCCYSGLKDLFIYQYGISCVKWMDYWMLKKPILAAYSGHLFGMPLASFGWQVPAENSLALADKIREVLALDDDVLAEKGKEGFRYLKANHHAEMIGRAYEKLVRA